MVVVPKAKAPTEENAAESWALVAAPGPTGVAQLSLEATTTLALF